MRNEKAVRLVEYLLRLASLRSKLVRDIDDYERVLWVNDIPRQKECFTQAWGRDEDYDTDIWAEVQKRHEPELPSIPDQCKDWIDKKAVRNKNDLPELLTRITRQIHNPAWLEGSDQPEYISRTERCDDYPEVLTAWNRYVEERWLPWTEEHNGWESIQKIYSALFAIHQVQRRLGEEYELVLGLGLLTWQTPTGQRVRRHLIVANALLKFEARSGKFTIQPMPDGANVRPEIDMLDIADQPARAEEAAKSLLSNAGDDPWEKDCIEGVLQALVHSISPQGEYQNTLEAKSTPSKKPVIEYAPAIILRKRSARGLTEILNRIKERLEKGGDIPIEFSDLIEPRSDAVSDNDPGEINGGFDGEVFFPKPSNEAQRSIVEKIRVASGVLVQGPPGTGKSHTIANLICHLLATGQRILITAKTPRALQVLMGRVSEDGKDEEGLVPEELRPLCINLLGSGPEEKRSLESSVGGILRKNAEWNEDRATGERKGLEQMLCGLREEKVKVDQQLRDIRESETHSQSIGEGNYRGTAARIAEAVNRDRSDYEWFADTVPLNQACPIQEKHLQIVLLALRRFTPEKRRELTLDLPDATLESLSSLVEREKRANEEVTHSTTGADEKIADLLLASSHIIIEAIRDALSSFHDALRQLSNSPYSWMRDALQDVTGGNPSMWRELVRVTRDQIALIETLVSVADDTSLDFPDDANIRALLEDVCVLKSHMENGGRLGWWLFRAKPVKERIHILKTVRVNGRRCSTVEHFSVLSNVLSVRVGCEKAWEFWVGRFDKTQGPYALQLQTLKALCDALDSVLPLERLIGKCRETLKQCPAIGQPVWADDLQIRQMIASCGLALARHMKRLAEDEIRSIEIPISSLAARSNAHPITSELLQTIRNRDTDGYARCWNTMQDLKKDIQHVRKVDEYITKLRRHVPKLTEELELTFNDVCWDGRIGQIQKAYHWAQARFWIEEYIRKEDAPKLAGRSKQIEGEISTAIAELASLHAWSFCFSRLEEKHRRHMEAWCKYVSLLTKTGKGKSDFKNRQAAQRSLNECKDAVPAWVMPLHRVWDTVDPMPGMFDVVIVDEASQCGFEALPLFYLGKKVLIVGDDKQISPGGEFQDTTPINKLIDEYLYDVPFKEYFGVDYSLFDHGKLRYGTRKITLREHFRCMPEIIRFSNDLCYRDTPLIPLRQYGPDRLKPLEHIFVSDGYREGSNDRVVNRPEANAIVDKIVELCGNSLYSDKTMGVIVLQGNAQAGLIEKKLLERLGAVEMERRHLICGNPYSFQGDERDIIFLSLVAASNERIGPLNKPADERRFNVAASRARDQMYLFHSVTCNDLNTSCLRRKLLEFFENTKPQEIGGINRDDLERQAAQGNRSVGNQPAPFESWFEIDVALELLRKGFVVNPQFEVAGKRIDLVVEGGQARMAVECDGDHWHGADRYDKDMQRQRQLERCGWEFFRVRESAFYSNKESALQGLWQALENRDILPGWSTKPITPDDEDKADDDDLVDEDNADESEDDHPLPEDKEGNGGRSSRRSEEVSPSEISGAILHALDKCPNRSCTVDSLTSRVLRELGVLTRGNPRLEFEKRVMRRLGFLEKRELIKKYKAKNKRVRLLKFSSQYPLPLHD
jgi:very-short-patch-repair endonuclease